MMKMIKKKYTIKDKRSMIEYIQRLNREQHIEIFKILYYDGIKYTENHNGIFINFHTVTDDTIEKISRFLNYCKNKQEELEKMNNDTRQERVLLDGNNNK